MNGVLERIIATQEVTDGTATLPLRHPDFPRLPVAIDEPEGTFLQDIVRDVQPRLSVEIGCAYGVSTLYICEALSLLSRPARHIAIDPYQSTQWRGIGRRHVVEAGFESLVEFREDYSERALPDLLRSAATIDFAFIDGWHTFDQVMMEFYFVNKMLRVGGVVAFDDADRRSVNRVIRHALTYPAYRVYGASAVAGERSMLGRGRRALASLPLLADIVRRDVIERDWDLGIFGSCVALRKIDDDKRSSGWDSAF